MSRRFSTDGPLPTRGALAAGCLLWILALIPVAGEAGETAQGEAGGRGDPLSIHPDLMASVRVPDLHQWGAKMDALLQSVFPEAPLPPGTSLGPVARHLRNPGLESIQTGAPLDVLLFDPQRFERSPLVLVFPVEEPRTYLRLLGSRPTITSQTGPEGLVHLREEHDTISDFFLTTVHRHIVVFGRDQNAVAAARTIYRQTEDTLLPHTTADAQAYIDVDRVFGSYSGVVDRAVRRMGSDAAAELSRAHPRLEEPVRRVLRDVLMDLQAITEQIDRIEISLALPGPAQSTRPSAVAEVEIVLHFESGEAAEFLNRSRARRPRLVGLLPARVLAFDWAALTPATSTEMIAGMTEWLLAALQEPLEPAPRRAVEDLHGAFRNLEPREMIGATLASPGGGPPQRALVLSMGRPGRWPDLLAAMEAAFGADGRLRDSLQRNGFDLHVERLPAPADAGPARVGEVRLSTALLGEEAGQRRERIAEHARVYSLARVDDHLVAASGANTEAVLAEFVDILVDGETPFADSALGPYLDRHITGRARATQSTSVLAAGGVRPVAYLRASQARTGLELPAGEDFDASSTPAAAPLLYTARRLRSGIGRTALSLRLVMPLRTARHTLEVCCAAGTP
jgi:hypothetical protein